jgi:hypothetical protein
MRLYPTSRCPSMGAAGASLANTTSTMSDAQRAAIVRTSITNGRTAESI